LKIDLKMAILSFLLNISFLNAYNFQNFKTISWDWIAIILLILLFAILLISIIRDIRNNKKKINTILVQEKCKTVDQNRYLSDINDNTIKNNDKIGKSLKLLTQSSKDKEIIEKLKSNYENIFLNTQEESIFLSIATNKDIGSTTIFQLDELKNELKQYGLLKNSSIKIKNTTSYPIVSNKEILQSIIFMLTKLQLKEHNLKKANIEVSVLDTESIIEIKIPKELKLNKDLLNILENGINPKYYNTKNKYYGVYLYLINKLSNRLNGNLIVNIDNKKTYTVEIKIPIDLIKKSTNTEFKPLKKLAKPKEALIVANNIEFANLLSTYLEQYNFNVDIEFGQELNKEIPNFLNYSIVFMEAELFEPILSDYIISVKKYSDLKVISIEENTKIYNYPENLIDDTIEKRHLKDELNKSIFTYYSSDLIDIDSKVSSDKTNTILQPEEPKKSKVLIADDDRTNLHILEYLLKQYGLEVCTASNGLEALEILNSNVCELIILDSIMPKMDGYETVKRLRENHKYNATPVVIHTSFSLNKSIEDIFKLGFDSYLPKPFNKYELEALLERYLPIKSIIKPKEEETKENIISTSKEEDLEEFLAIYSDSDRLIERYIKENRNEQATSVLEDLKKVSNKIGAFKFINTIEKVEKEIANNSTNKNDIIYTLSENLKELKTSIIKQLNR